MKANAGAVYTVYNQYLKRYTACQVAYIAPPDTDCDLPSFASGWGDGYSPVYFGYDAKGEICAVYVRFIDIEASYREKE